MNSFIIFNSFETAGDDEWLINNKFGTTLEGVSSGLISGQLNVPAGACDQRQSNKSSVRILIRRNGFEPGTTEILNRVL